jgi:hypothetical protein
MDLDEIDDLPEFNIANINEKSYNGQKDCVICYEAIEPSTKLKMLNC